MWTLETTPPEHGRELPPLPTDVTIEVQRILGAAPEGTSVFMTGSIVEGFGNEHSDVDLYLVHDEGRPEQAIAIGMRRSRYVDCEYFAARALRRLADRMNSAGWAELANLRVSEIDRYYRLAASAPLRVTTAFSETFGGFNRRVARDVFGKSALWRASELFGAAAILAATGDARAAELTLRYAALWLANAELAGDGEGYPSPKWIGEKAARRYGRSSQKFDAVITECLRPAGEFTTRLARLRERLIVPPGLGALLDGQTCELSSGVRVLRGADGWLFVHETLGVATVAGPVGAAIASLAQGVSWSEAAEKLSGEIGISCREVLAGAWHESAALRSSGHLVERRQA